MILETRGITRRDVDRRATFPRRPEPINRWLRCVKNNHGGHVSERTIRALTKFYKNLKNTTILKKIFILNPLVPDSIEACLTPLIDVTGKFLWLNSKDANGNIFTPTDLTMGGLSRKSTDTPYIDTQFNPLTWIPSVNDVGATFYISERPTWEGTITTNHHFGCTEAGGAKEFRFYFKGIEGNDSMFLTDESNGYKLSDTVYTSSEAQWQRGFISYNRASDIRANIWKANEFFAVADWITNNNTANTAGFPDVTCYLFNTNVGNTPVIYSSYLDRFSCVAVHTALTQGEAQTFNDLIVSLRQNIGGGWQGHI